MSPTFVENIVENTGWKCEQYEQFPQEERFGCSLARWTKGLDCLRYFEYLSLPTYHVLMNCIENVVSRGEAR